MPLEISEDTAISLAVRKIVSNDGDVTGVQSYLRGLGAHYEQARKLTARAQEAYEESLRVTPPTEEQRAVSVAVETSQGELNVTLKADRLPITTLEELVEFYEIDTDVWQPASTLFNFWGSEANPNFQVRARFEKDRYAEAAKYDREAFREWAKDLVPDWGHLSYEVDESGSHMLELVLSDLHFGKESNDSNWLTSLESACHSILTRARDYNIGAVNIVLLGDTFHSEGRRGTTTKGTPQDDSVDWRQTFTDAREFLAGLALHALEMTDAPVNIVVIAGNHDFERSYYLQDSLHAYFHNHPHVDVPLSSGIRSYLRWGSTTIGLSHGDAVKESDLPLVMMREAGANANHQWHLGHYHTRGEKEVQGILIRYFGTPSDPGEWDLTKGFGGNRREIAGVIFDKEEGEIATLRRVIK